NKFALFEDRTPGNGNTLASIDDVAMFTRNLLAVDVASLNAGELNNTGIVGNNFTHLVGTSEGKVYSWDGIVTYTEIFDVRRFEWFETGTDTFYSVGDVAGTETAQSQSFQVSV